MNFRILGAVTCAAAMLCGCGGGGGSSGPRLTLNVSELSLGSSANDGSSPQATITGRLSGNPGSLFLFIQHTDLGIAAVGSPTISGNTGSSAVQMRPGTSLGHGTYKDTIVVTACVDSSCNQQYEGSPAQIAVTYTVGIPVNRESVALTVVEGEARDAGALSFSHYAGSQAWGIQSSRDWMTTTPATGSTTPAETVVHVASQPVGQHEAALTITAGSEQRALPVSYTVLPLLEASLAGPISVTNANAYGAISFETTVRSRVAARQADWRAAVEGLPWVTLTRASGDTNSANTVSLTISPEALRSLSNGTYQGAVLISSTTPGVSSISVPLKIVVDRSIVNVAAPHAIAADRAGDLILSGERLNEIGEIDAVLLGDIPATRIAVEGGIRRQLRISYPPLGAGRHPVALSANGRRIASIASIVAVTSANFVAAGQSPALDISPPLIPWVYDATRQALYRFPSLEEGPIQAVRLTPSGWISQQSGTRFDGFIDAALSQSGSEILALSADRQIVSIDPETLAVRSSTPLNLSMSATLLFNGAAGAHDGSYWVPADAALLRYDEIYRSVKPIHEDAPELALAPSATGNVLLHYAPISEGSNIYRVDALSRARTLFLPNVQTSITKILGDRFGDRWALIGEPSHSDGHVEIRSGDANLLGIVDPRPNSYVDALLTPDGDQLILTFESYNGRLNPSLEIYDLTATPADGRFPRTATLPFDGQDFSIIGITPDNRELLMGCCDRVTAIALP